MISRSSWVTMVNCEAYSSTLIKSSSEIYGKKSRTSKVINACFCLSGIVLITLSCRKCFSGDSPWLLGRFLCWYHLKYFCSQCQTRNPLSNHTTKAPSQMSSQRQLNNDVMGATAGKKKWMSYGRSTPPNQCSLSSNGDKQSFHRIMWRTGNKL